MSMDQWLIVQVILILMVLSAAKKGTVNRGLVLLLLASWLAPVFFIGFFRAIFVWVVSTLFGAMVLAVYEKLFKNP